MNKVAKHYKNLAGNMYANYSGVTPGGRRDQYIGQEKIYANMGGYGQANLMSESKQSRAALLLQQDPDMQELTVNITNSDTQKLAAPLFSVTEDIAVPFNGVADTITGNTAGAGVGIVVTYDGYGTGNSEIQNVIRTSPFTIGGARYNFGDETQIKEKWQKRTKFNETICTKPYRPFLKRNLANNVTTELDDPEFFFAVDSRATLFVIVAAASASTTPREVQISFRYSTQFDPTNAMEGAPVVREYGSRKPLITDKVF